MRPELEYAARMGDAAAIADLLDRGLDVDALDRHGQTALMLAAHAGHDELVKLLISRGASLDVTAKYGLSALMLAIVAEHEATARILVQAGAIVGLRGTGAPGFAGKTAYDLAREREMTDLCKELEAGGIPDA